MEVISEDFEPKVTGTVTIEFTADELRDLCLVLGRHNRNNGPNTYDLFDDLDKICSRNGIGMRL